MLYWFQPLLCPFFFLLLFLGMLLNCDDFFFFWCFYQYLLLLGSLWYLLFLFWSLFRFALRSYFIRTWFNLDFILFFYLFLLLFIEFMLLDYLTMKFMIPFAHNIRLIVFSAQSHVISLKPLVNFILHIFGYPLSVDSSHKIDLNRWVKFVYFWQLPKIR